MNLNWMQRKITIIGLYTPFEDEEINIKDQFFAKFKGIIVEIGNTRELLLLVDFKGKTGREINNKIMEPYVTRRH
jgi:hypothetical protein